VIGNATRVWFVQLAFVCSPFSGVISGFEQYLNGWRMSAVGLHRYVAGSYVGVYPLTGFANVSFVRRL
jgi:hypothetical protein